MEAGGEGEGKRVLQLRGGQILPGEVGEGLAAIFGCPSCAVLKRPKYNKKRLFVLRNSPISAFKKASTLAKSFNSS